MKRSPTDDGSVLSAFSATTPHTSNGRVVTGRGVDYFRKSNTPKKGTRPGPLEEVCDENSLVTTGSPKSLGTMGTARSVGKTSLGKGGASSVAPATLCRTTTPSTNNTCNRNGVPTNTFVNTNRDPKCVSLRKKVIFGDFMNGTCSAKGGFVTTNSKWKFKQWQMLVFISSTFTDTRLERNILLDDILPELRDEAIQHDIEVTFVDMRWGIRDEHTLKHRTWLECQKELQRCKDESCGLFFLSLQSEKYGYRPLPRAIDKNAFERAVAIRDNDVKALAKAWFRYDENSIPPQYILRDLESLEDSSFWNDALPKLREAFMGIRFDKTLSNSVILGRSISEWEAKFSLVTDEDAARSLWIHRSFTDGEENSKFADTAADGQTHSKLNELKKWISLKIKKVTPQRVHSYSDISLDSYLSEHNHDFDVYTSSMRKNTMAVMQAELRNIITVKLEFDEDGCGMHLSGKLLEEFLHHANWAHDLCSSFIGREALVQMGVTLAQTPNQVFEDSRAVVARSLLSGGGKVHKFRAISYVVIGAPGVGKSAFMAKIANELFNLYNSVDVTTAVAGVKKGRTVDKTSTASSTSTSAVPQLAERLVLIRFCGTGNGTTSIHSLISGLVYQIEYCLNPTTTPRERSKLSCFRRFRELVRDHPLVILIDSIDKIVGGMEIFENLSIHHDTRLMISVTKMKNESNMTLFAAENDVPFLEVGNLTTQSTPASDEEAEIAVIVDQYLRRKSRKLSQAQRKLVMEKIESDPRAIYLSLVLREVEKWQSFEILKELVLKESTVGVMCQILDKVELDCGVLLSRLAIGCLTLSVNGINDIEMEDLLSLNNGVLYAVFQYDYPKIFRLPSHVWLRLRNSLIGLIVERQRGCLHWHHEELQSIALGRFVSTEERETIHRTLGTYFSNRVDPETQLKGRITLQPLRVNGISPFLPGANINTRRCNEGAHHLIEGGLFVEAAEEMCNLEYVAACVLSGEGYGLLTRVQMLAAHFEKDTNHPFVAKRVSDYNHWLSAKFDAISTDSPILMLTVTASMESVTSCVRQDLVALVKETRMDNEHHKFLDNSWIRGTTLHDSEKGFVDPPYKTYNSCAVWSPNSARIATVVGNETVAVWDVKELSVIGRVVCPGKHPILQVSWASDNRHLAISSRTEVFIWNASFDEENPLPELVKTLGVSTDRVQVGRFSPIALELATAAHNRSITIWGGGNYSPQNSYTATKGSIKFSKRKVALPDISEIGWSRDGQVLSGLTLGTLRIWKSSETVPKATFTPAHGSRILASDFSPDGKRIATASEDGLVTIWNTFTTAQHTIFSQHRTSVMCVSWHSGGSLIATGSKDGIVMVWNVVTGEVLQHLFGHYHDIVDVSWSPNGLELVTASSNDHYILWDSTKNGGRHVTKT